MLTRRQLGHYLLMVVLFLVALVPRLVALGRYVTPDELTWVYRSVLFREALLGQRWADTLTAGHPGVITTWLGSLAITLQMWLEPGSRAAYEWVTKLAWLAPDNGAAFAQLATFLDGGRVAVAVVNSLGILGMLALIRRLYNSPVALLACFLLALDPFLSGLSGLLHVDGLMTTFATLSLLALALFVRQQGREGWKMPAIAGMFAALAALTKSPALLLVPITGVAFLLAYLWRAQPWPGLRAPLTSVGAWLFAFLLPLLLLFPALWQSPSGVLSLTSRNANRHLEEALRPTYFMGEVALDHGAAFYPVVLGFRLSPVVFAGLILGAVLTLYLLLRRRRLPSRPTWLLLIWSVLFLLGITLAAKKFDRYALPVLPALIVLAALSWWQLRVLLYRGTSAAMRSLNAGTLLLILLQGLYLANFFPYPLAAYNLLVGGPAVAQEALPVGWGEAASSAAQWLAEANSGTERVATENLPAVAPYYRGPAVRYSNPGAEQPEYLILTAASRQLDAEQFAAIATTAERVHTVSFAGLEQGWVFRLPQMSDSEGEGLSYLPDAPVFDNLITLHGAAARANGTVVTTVLKWGLAQPATRSYTLRLELRDGSGYAWANLEAPLLSDVYFYPQDWATSEEPEVAYMMEPPAAMPPGEYQIVVKLFDAQSGEQLPVLQAGEFAGLEVAAATVTVPLGEVVAPSTLHVPVPTRQSWFDGELVLLGHAPLPEVVADGDSLFLQLYWHAPTGLAADVELMVELAGQNLQTLPLSRLPVDEWRGGETLHELYTIPVPTGFPAGTSELSIDVCRAGEPESCESAVLGQVEVAAIKRLYELPANIGTPLNVAFTTPSGTEIRLAGYDLERDLVEPGDAVPLVLYWQVVQRSEDLLTAFVHMQGPDGNNLAQSDQWPGGLPASLWTNGQVIVDEQMLSIPAGTPLGHFPLYVGLYQTESGVRLRAYGVSGEQLEGDRFMLPELLEVR